MYILGMSQAKFIICEILKSLINYTFTPKKVGIFIVNYLCRVKIF